MKHPTKQWYATLGAAAAAAAIGAIGAIGIAACGPAPFEFEKVEAEAPAPNIPVDATDSISAAMREPNAYARASRLAALLANAGPEALPEIKQILDDPVLTPGAAETELLMRFWATYEPREASVWAADYSAMAYRQAAVLVTVDQWAQRDPQAVLKQDEEFWRLKHDVSGAAQVALVRGWFARDPAELASYIQEMGMGIEGQRLLSAFVKVMIRRMGSEATIRWADSVPEDDESFKLAVYRQLSSALTLLDHETALSWCETHCEGPYGKDLRATIATRWARREGAPAIEWLAKAPAGHEKDLGLRAAYAGWGEVDRQAALAWMAQQVALETPPDWLTPIYPVYTHLLARVSPSDAIQAAAHIVDPEERNWVLVEVARRWRTVDDAAAQAWLEGSPLSDAEREKVMAPLPVARPGPPPMVNPDGSEMKREDVQPES